eukprot:CAMPEP_0113617776 /NCGR_PEP_ID=MMETSP0017_2-20120614/8971_1 /TAXON_ID=2856 /ORGANISM="Cylindrotheca closterium" /LENGTH=159 /DNA_ID=CAMNT_0000527215 /DNA_START=54 /DNA_END=533 /DNA_ORIENTATION=- /assembly_acc=CAM_ASM_000147
MARSGSSDGYVAETTPKQGHVVFFLCDSRRAVIFLDTFAVIFYLICIAFYGWQTAIDFQGDFNGVDSITDNHWIVIAFLFVGLLCASLGLSGARNYNQCFSFTASLWYGLSFLMNFFTMNIPNAILMFVLAYPHIVFYYEVKEGTMSGENYQNEVYCCV